ncbi:hypothetical protein QJS04_geneDACA006331 [Acorus gramineus]|uniref:RING-type domain-containing protein n=1 Tax=Acorus gramineus TaxID=55184 RepID=A0AAV9AWS2_ACOGR|nr:hypothetical protein QJS04_geneDACA006331 [Acorus gramineus]
MPGAFELFYARRSRSGRNPTSIASSSSSSAAAAVEADQAGIPGDDQHHSHRRFLHRDHHHRRSRYGSGEGHDVSSSGRGRSYGIGGGGRGGPSHARHLCHHHASHMDRESIQLDHGGSSETVPGNNSSGETSSSRTSSLRLTQNDRLPGAVLLARARLLERLRGVSLSGNSVVSGLPWDESATSDDFRLAALGDWETESPSVWSSELNAFLPEQRVQFSMTGLPPARDPNKEKPPGLSKEAFSGLPREFFHDEEGEDGVISKECCICLERFLKGDGLIRLSCGHRFHASCLGPWASSCGDCPYCRKSIVIGRGGSEVR